MSTLHVDGKRTVRGIRREASIRAERWGHRLGIWREVGETSYASCRVCGASVVCCVEPQETWNGATHAGAGLLTNCETWSAIVGEGSR